MDINFDLPPIFDVYDDEDFGFDYQFTFELSEVYRDDIKFYQQPVFDVYKKDEIVVLFELLPLFDELAANEDERNPGIKGAHRVFDEMRDRDVVLRNTSVMGMISAYEFYIKALELFYRMPLKANDVIVLIGLPTCGECGDQLMAVQVPCYIVRVTFIHMYGKSGNTKGFRQYVDEIVEKNNVSWNSLISMLAFMGSHKDSLTTFIFMVDGGVMIPNSVTNSSILIACVDLECFRLGKEIHVSVLQNNIETDIFVGDSLIDIYSISGSSIHLLLMLDASGNDTRWLEMYPRAGANLDTTFRGENQPMLIKFKGVIACGVFHQVPPSSLLLYHKENKEVIVNPKLEILRLKTRRSFLFPKLEAETADKVSESCLQRSLFFLNSGYNQEGAFSLFGEMSESKALACHFHILYFDHGIYTRPHTQVLGFGCSLKFYFNFTFLHVFELYDEGGESRRVHIARDHLRMSIQSVLACDVVEVFDKKPQHGKTYYSHGRGKFQDMASMFKVVLGNASIKVPLVVVIQVIKLLNSVGILAIFCSHGLKAESGIYTLQGATMCWLIFFRKIKELKMIRDLAHHMQIKGLLTRETCPLICYRYARARIVRIAIETFQMMKEFGLNFLLLKLETENHPNKMFDKISKINFVLLKAQASIFISTREFRLLTDHLKFSFLHVFEGYTKEVEKNDVVITFSETSSAKTTQLPRPVVAATVAKRMAEECGIELRHKPNMFDAAKIREIISAQSFAARNWSPLLVKLIVSSIALLDIDGTCKIILLSNDLSSSDLEIHLCEEQFDDLVMMKNLGKTTLLVFLA